MGLLQVTDIVLPEWKRVAAKSMSFDSFSLPGMANVDIARACRDFDIYFHRTFIAIRKASGLI